VRETVLRRGGTRTTHLNAQSPLLRVYPQQGAVCLLLLRSFRQRAFFFATGFAADFFLGAIVDLLSVRVLTLRDLARLNRTRVSLRSLCAPDSLRGPWLSLSHHQIEHRAASGFLDALRDPLADAAAVKQDLLSLLALHATPQDKIVRAIDSVLS